MNVKALRVALLSCVACVAALGCARERPVTITGRVVSQGQPVEGARVRWQAAPNHVLTDADGQFRLPRSASIPAGDDEPTPLITAAKVGYFIAGVPPADEIEIQLSPLPEQDQEAYAWIDPAPSDHAAENCGNCHREIYEQWQAGGHANSAANRHFLNLYDGSTWDGSDERGWSLLAEYPEGAGVCAACHAPGAPLDTLATGDLRTLAGVDSLGIHCDFCHKVQDVDLAAPGLTHGRFAMSLLRPEEGQIFFGPLDDVARHEDSFLPLQSESRFCAACHEGIVFGVPVYTTYSEWLASPARAEGKQCQSCHMRPDGQMTNIAPGAGGLERDPATLASHRLLPGGREAMLRRALTLTATAHSEPEASAIGLRVHLAAHDVGHRVPTGFVDRHLLLVVTAYDAAGQSVEPIDGPRLPSGIGAEENQPGMLFAKLLLDAEGRGPVPFWREGAMVHDTRIDPAAPQTVEFTLASTVDRVQVRLLYRRFWQTTAIEKGWPDPTLAVFDRSWSISELLSD
jgi:hypothetical protein